MPINMYNVPNVEAQFKNYLSAVNISPVSIRNYLSDLRYFHGWVCEKYLLSQDNWLNCINLTVIHDYRRYLTMSNIPTQTINRRLSGLRKFCEYLDKNNLIEGDIANQIPNLTDRASVISDNSDLLLRNFQYDLLLESDREQVDTFTDNIKDLLQFTSLD